MPGIPVRRESFRHLIERGAQLKKDLSTRHTHSLHRNLGWSPQVVHQGCAFQCPWTCSMWCRAVPTAVGHSLLSMQGWHVSTVLSVCTDYTDICCLCGRHCLQHQGSSCHTWQIHDICVRHLPKFLLSKCTVPCECCSFMSLDMWALLFNRLCHRDA